ncbi:MAG: DUF1445 domain-containing protein [Dehalococcoidales bacterium]|nr:DUF1445 domain-containing protein [Dehalococcoidales bacterium]
MIKYTEADLSAMSPDEFRNIVRSGQWTEHSMNKCRGYAVTDMVIIPKEYAYDYLVFAHRNPETVSIVDMTEAGSPHPLRVAPDADLRTDLPRYQVYQNGKIIDEPTDIKKYWRDDLVGFLTGCSESFDWALKNANVQYQVNGVFSTNIACVPVGPFRGNMAVSCRLFKTSFDATRAVQISSRHRIMHGAPVHIGDGRAIGIRDLSRPDLIAGWEGSKAREPAEGEVAMFWACGATNRIVAAEAKLPLMIVDYPVSVFITDKLVEELAIL